MSPSLLPPNPSLVAILLVVKTKSEPRLVFHYPPKPGEDNTRFQNLVKELAGDDSSTTSSGDGESSGEDGAPAEVDQATALTDEKNLDVYEVGSVSPEKQDGFPEEAGKAQWNDIFGYPAGIIAKLLCPHEVNHKRRTEIGLEGKVFLGQPAFAGTNGEWQKKKLRRSSSKGAPQDDALELSIERLAYMLNDGTTRKSKPVTGTKPKDSVAEPAAESREEFTDEHLEDESRREIDESKKTITIDDNKPRSFLNMFHVSFVLDPPPLEYHLRVKEMYENVIRKFTKALRWEQARTHFIAKEASTITSITKRVTRSSGRLKLWDRTCRSNDVRTSAKPKLLISRDHCRVSSGKGHSYSIQLRHHVAHCASQLNLIDLTFASNTSIDIYFSFAICPFASTARPLAYDSSVDAS